MKYKLYTTSETAWEGMFKAIEGAKISVYMEMYILSSDTDKTHNFFSVLEEKAKLGLEVVVIVDAYGSMRLEGEKIKNLKQAGVQFLFFSHLLKRNHRKILIVDNELAFVGGVNIKEYSRNWRDLQIRIKGAPVKMLIKSFANTYRLCGGKRVSILKYSYTSLPKKIKNWIFDNWHSSSKMYSLNGYYRDKLITAKSLIQLVTPYLMPPRWFLASIHEACLRGVKVEIIIPGDTDIKSLNKINFLNACRFSDMGAKIYLGKQMNHAKMMLIDNEEAAIGSQNLDVLSFGLNYEAGIFSRQKDLVLDVLEIIEKWKGEASKLTSCRKMKFIDKILFYSLKIFYPIF